MSKYVTSEADIFTIFGSVEWKAEGIASYPSNYIANASDQEFIRISIIPSSQGINLVSVEGVIMIDIFTEAKLGDRRSLEIADKLDLFMVGKSFNNAGRRTQIFDSTLRTSNTSDDDTRSRKIYSIPFKHFGVN